MAHNYADESQTRSYNGTTDRHEHRPTSFGVFDPLRHVIDHMSQDRLSRSELIIRDRLERMNMCFIWHDFSLASCGQIVEGDCQGIDSIAACRDLQIPLRHCEAKTSGNFSDEKGEEKEEGRIKN
jgi:hypothetical protein